MHDTRPICPPARNRGVGTRLRNGSAPSRVSRRRCPSGFTLLDLILAMVLVGITSTFAVPAIQRLLDGIAVRGAMNDADALLLRARHIAMARGERATFTVDTARGIITLTAGRDTIARRNETELAGVRLLATRTSVVYAPTGLGFGLSNLTLIATRRTAADTLTVSRLGRVRW